MMNPEMDKTTALVWGLWLGGFIASFAVLEEEAIRRKRWWTLSHFTWQSAEVWPPLGVLYGIVFGGLAVHFFWTNQGLPKKPRRG